MRMLPVVLCAMIGLCLLTLFVFSSVPASAVAEPIRVVSGVPQCQGPYCPLDWPERQARREAAPVPPAPAAPVGEALSCDSVACEAASCESEVGECRARRTILKAAASAPLRAVAKPIRFLKNHKPVRRCLGCVALGRRR
jgi:hypothetical protein